eukprot:g734.t1
MHRQFTPSGVERDVSRWLKELGYRGPGLRRETLAPLCRGEMVEIWQTLMNCCRSETKVHEIQTTMTSNTRRQASRETRQRLQEEKTRLHELNKYVEELTVNCKTQENELEILESEIHRLQKQLIKIETQYCRHRELMESKHQQMKILEAGRLRLKEIARGVGRDVESLQRHLSHLKSILKTPGGELTEQGKTDLKTVLALMYELTQQSVSEGVRNRPEGEIFTPENLLPKLECNEQSDRRLNELFQSIGQLYSKQRKLLTPLFVQRNEDAWINIRLYEMKYSSSSSETPVSTQIPARALEELQVAHMARFVQQKQAEMESLKRQKSSRTSLPPQSPTGSDSQLRFTLLQELHCLRSELSVLENELSRLKSESDVKTGRETKELYKKLTGQIEHSKQMDVLLVFFIKEFKQMQKSFQKSANKIKEKLQELSKCEGALSSECRDFCPVSLFGKMKQLSLTETPPEQMLQTDQPSILQRLDLGMKSANNQGYWINSFAQLFSEMKQLKPCLPLEGPESLFRHLSQGLETAMANATIHDELRRLDEEIEAETRTLCESSKTLITKDEERYQWVNATVDQIDGNLKQGHEALHSLEKEVKTAFDDYRELPAFVCIPFYRRNDINASEWFSRCLFAVRRSMFVVEVLRLFLFPLRGCLSCAAADLDAEEESDWKLKLSSPHQIQQQETELIFDLELEETEEIESSTSTNVLDRIHTLQYSEDAYIHEVSRVPPFGVDTLSQIKEIVESCACVGLNQVSTLLASSGYQVFQRTVNSRCRSLSRLENRFLVLKRRRSRENNNIWEAEMEEIFIELKFKEHFISTLLPKYYKQLVDTLPSVIVAERNQFRTLVSFISAEMKSAFNQSNHALPPWRTETAILSNWYSQDYVEIELPDFSSARLNNEIESIEEAVTESSLLISTGSRSIEDLI